MNTKETVAKDQRSPKHFEFKLVSPEQHLLTELVDMVVIPGALGNFGVLPAHAPLISNLRPGLVSVYKNDTIKHIFVMSGFAHVHESGCTVLAESCEFIEDIDLRTLEEMAQEITANIQTARTESEQKELRKNHEMVMFKLHLLKKISRH